MADIEDLDLAALLGIEEPDEEEEETEATVALRQAIASAVAHLVKTGAIEVAEGSQAQLVEELLPAAQTAATSRQLLKKLRGALFRSEHVADVFASDLELEQSFRTALGG